MTERPRPRPLLDIIDGQEHDAAATRAALHRMLLTTEEALDALGIDRDSTAGRLMRLVVRVAGLGVLNRTAEQLAEEVDCTVRHVHRLREKLRPILAYGATVKGGQKTGIALRARWTAIVEIAGTAVEPNVEWEEVTSTMTSGVTLGVTSDVTSGVTYPMTSGVTFGVTSDVTFEDPSLYVPNNAIHNRYRSSEIDEPKAAAAAVDLDSHADAFEVLLKAYPAHQRPEVREAAWELAFVAVYVGMIRSQNVVKIVRDQIATKAIKSPSNYALITAEKLCGDVGLKYRELRSRCPPVPILESVTKQVDVKIDKPMSKKFEDVRISAYLHLKKMRIEAKSGRPLDKDDLDWIERESVLIARKTYPNFKA